VRLRRGARLEAFRRVPPELSAAADAFLSGVAPLAALGGVLIGCLIAVGILLGTMAAGDGSAAAMQAVEGAAVGNTEAVGWVLYTTYLVPFEVVSVVLLVAMIGAIVLTLRHKPNVRRQNISDQVARLKSDAIEVVKVRPGQGL